MASNAVSMSGGLNSKCTSLEDYLNSEHSAFAPVPIGHLAGGVDPVQAGVMTSRESGIARGYTERMAKVMISLPDEVLSRVDREARRRGTSRSGFLREAALHELGRPDPAALDAAVARSRKRFVRAGRFDSASLVRADRDAH
jgi:predicted transcriptional regulator